MTDFQMVQTDRGRVNARIMAKEAKVDFRRVEGASLKLQTRLTSAEGKRLFVRLFQTLQLNAYFVSVIARTRVDAAEIDAMDAALRADMDAVKEKLYKAIDDAEALFKANGIGAPATYDTEPLDVEVGVLSSSGRRYLELFTLFDQLMPLLQTLEIHEVISAQDMDQQRMSFKRMIRKVATAARQRAGGIRRRMNALSARRPERLADDGVKDTLEAEPVALASPDQVGVPQEPRVRLEEVPATPGIAQ